jgi:GT2 family glycosyltransferase
MRAFLGVLLKDLPRYMPALVRGDQSYLALCNRYESLSPSPDGRGYLCKWQWTSDLHAPKVMPFLGRWLMARALRDHPIGRSRSPRYPTTDPEISFLIGHRGREREPLLLATIESVAAQEGAKVECIVVEQDTEPRLAGRLPNWVRLIHTPPPTPETPYIRSRAFNVGAAQARGGVLVLHDNDMLVPADYAREILARAAQGYEAINLKRFIFFLSQRHTGKVIAGGLAAVDQPPVAVMQNAEGGGSIAITQDAFDRICGMDESFMGWGGEDNEFWERAQTCRVWPYGYLPLVHLWHPMQTEKRKTGAPGNRRFYDMTHTPPEVRIAKLREAKRRAQPGLQNAQGSETLRASG